MRTISFATHEIHIAATRLAGSIVLITENISGSWYITKVGMLSVGRRHNWMIVHQNLFILSLII